MSDVYALLNELNQRGIELRADGDRLQYRPRAALTPDLILRVKEQKPALLSLLTDVIQSRQHAGSRSPLFRFSDALMEFGDICAGWTPRAWAVELRRKAGRCEEGRPDIADYFRRWAAFIEAKLQVAESDW